MNVAGPGDLIGYADFIDARGRRAQVFEAEALTKTSVALFTRDHILRLVQSFDQETRSRLIERVNTAWSITLCQTTAGMTRGCYHALHFIGRQVLARAACRIRRRL